MKLFALFLFAGALYAQAPAPTLPDYTIGAGTIWTRGASYPAAADVTVGVRLGTTKIYSWTNISTPIASVPAGAAPVASTITTGIAYVPVQSRSGSVSLLFIGQAGISTISAGGLANPSVSLAASGSIGVAFRVGKSNVYVMPYAKASNPVTGNGGILSAILQPGLQIFYSFSAK